MERPPAVDTRPDRVWCGNEAGITLVEVLAALFIMAVGMLAVLALFPLGAIEVARAIKDDRAAAFAAQAVEFGESGEALLGRMLDFVQFSMASQSADPDEAAELREDYQQLARDAAVVEAELTSLQWALPRPLAQRFLAPLLTQIHSIQRRIDLAIQLLQLIEDGKLSP